MVEKEKAKPTASSEAIGCMWAVFKTPVGWWLWVIVLSSILYYTVDCYSISIIQYSIIPCIGVILYMYILYIYIYIYWGLSLYPFWESRPWWFDLSDPGDSAAPLRNACRSLNAACSFRSSDNCSVAKEAGRDMEQKIHKNMGVQWFILCVLMI